MEPQSRTYAKKLHKKKKKKKRILPSWMLEKNEIKEKGEKNSHLESKENGNEACKKTKKKTKIKKDKPSNQLKINDMFVNLPFPNLIKDKKKLTQKKEMYPIKKSSRKKKLAANLNSNKKRKKLIIEGKKPKNKEIKNEILQTNNTKSLQAYKVTSSTSSSTTMPRTTIFVMAKKTPATKPPTEAGINVPKKTSNTMPSPIATKKTSVIIAEREERLRRVELRKKEEKEKREKEDQMLLETLLNVESERERRLEMSEKKKKDSRRKIEIERKEEEEMMNLCIETERKLTTKVTNYGSPHVMAKMPDGEPWTTRMSPDTVNMMKNNMACGVNNMQGETTNKLTLRAKNATDANLELPTCPATPSCSGILKREEKRMSSSSKENVKNVVQKTQTQSQKIQPKVKSLLQKFEKGHSPLKTPKTPTSSRKGIIFPQKVVIKHHTLYGQPASLATPASMQHKAGDPTCLIGCTECARKK